MKSGVFANPLFLQLLLFESLCQFGTAMINPIVSSFAVALGAAASFAGVVSGLNPLSATVLRPLAGVVLGRGDRTTLLIVASCIGAASSLSCAMFASMPFLVASRVILGASFVIKSSIVVSFASAVVPKDKVGQGVGLIGLAYTVSLAIAPGIGSAIGSAFGYHAAYLVSGALFVAAICTALLIRASSRVHVESAGSENEGEGERRADDRKRVQGNENGGKRAGLSALFHIATIPFGLVAIFETLVQGALSYLLLLVADERGVEGASAFFFVYAIVTVLARPFSSRLYDRFGIAKVFYPEAVIMITCPIVLMFAYSLPLYLVAAVAFGLGWGSIHPTFQAESVRGVRPADAALAANTYYMGSDIGMALGPIVGGAVLQVFGSTAMFAGCAVMGVLLIVSFTVWNHWTTGKGEN